MAISKNNTLLAFDFGAPECFPEGISDKDVANLDVQSPIGTPTKSFHDTASIKSGVARQHSAIWQRTADDSAHDSSTGWAAVSQVHDENQSSTSHIMNWYSGMIGVPGLNQMADSTNRKTFCSFYFADMNDCDHDDCQSTSSTVSTAVSDVHSDEEIEAAVAVVEDYSLDRSPDWSGVEYEDWSVDDLFADDEWIVTSSTSAVLGSLVGICA